MKSVHIVILAAGLLSGCNEHKVAINGEVKNTIRFEDVHSSALSEKGWVTTFASRGGGFEGMDSDSEISFSDGGSVSMTEYGYAPTEYSGTYTIDGRGEITANFEKYPKQWPKMILRRVEGRILLFRSDDAAALELGGRGGAVETAEMKPFWPFGLTKLTWERPKARAVESIPYEEPHGILPPIDSN